VAVTAHPTAAWTALPLREAFPWDEVPRYVIHDRDHAFDRLGTAAMGMEEVLTAPRAPWHNAFVERFIGSPRRECFDHVIVFNEAGPASTDDALSFVLRTVPHTLVTGQRRADSSSGHAG
jgi:transposase InsO family protein